MQRIAPWKIILVSGLVALNTVLAIAIGFAFFSDVDIQPTRMEWRPSIQVLDKTLPESRPISAYPLTLAQPIFFKSRSPYAPPPPPPPPPVLPAQLAAPIIFDPGFVIGGILMSQGVRKAYLFKKTDSGGAWVGAGDDISGWTLQSVGSNSVALRHGDRLLELKLYTEP